MNSQLKIIVSGTDTGVGKTFFCILVGKFLQKQKETFVIYKPFATGIIRTKEQMQEIEDIYIYRHKLKLQINKNLFVYKTFNFPNAPTVSSIMDKKKLTERDFKKSIELYKYLEKNYKNIIIEGIGGLLVPITFKKLFIDFIKALNLPVILITTNKLGTINHTLLSIKVLKDNKIPFQLVFNKIDPHKSQKENKAILNDIKYFGNVNNVIELPYTTSASVDRLLYFFNINFSPFERQKSRYKR